jgi:hypothetical protein
MTTWFNDFRIFLGRKRFRALAILLVSTGLLSTVALFINQEWSLSAQTILAFIFLIGAVGIIISAMEGDQRYRWGAILIPAVLALVIGAVLVPHLFGFAVGGAVGWVVAGLFIFGRTREPMAYKVAVKALRKGNLDEAVKAMDGIIKEEPEVAHHYRFRAELLRFAGKLPRAKSDYERMKNLAKSDTEKAVAYNGIAEVELQAKNYKTALQAAEKAYELAPQDWVTAYNMGMIQDRLRDSQAVLDSLTQKLNGKVADARHRLLIDLYVLRAYARLGNFANAQNTLTQLKRHKNGLREWELLLGEQNASVLRDVLSDDINLLRQLMNGETSVESVA